MSKDDRRAGTVPGNTQIKKVMKIKDFFPGSLIAAILAIFIGAIFFRLGFHSFGCVYMSAVSLFSCFLCGRIDPENY